MISHWLTVLKHKMPSQILIKTLDWFGKCCARVHTWVSAYTTVWLLSAVICGPEFSLHNCYSWLSWPVLIVNAARCSVSHRRHASSLKSKFHKSGSPQPIAEYIIPHESKEHLGLGLEFQLLWLLAYRWSLRGIFEHFHSNDFQNGSDIVCMHIMQ